MKPLKELYEDIMRELFVHGDRKGARYIIAYKENVWLFSGDQIDSEMSAEIMDAVPGMEERFPGGPPDSYWDFRDTASSDEGLELIFAEIQKRTLYYDAMGSFVMDPRSSVTLKKIVKELGLSGIERTTNSGEGSERVSKKKMTGEIANIVYHGTSSAYLDKILRLGLRAGEVESNYQQVIRQDPEYLDKIEGQVFFTSRFDEAQHHATYTAEKLKSGIPVVLQMRIPNKDLVQTDYDIGRLFPDEPSKGKSLGRETGIYGYEGSILPSFIDYVFVPKPEFVMDKEKLYYMSVKDFKKLNKQRALSYTDKVEQYY